MTGIDWLLAAAGLKKKRRGGGVQFIRGGLSVSWLPKNFTKDRWLVHMKTISELICLLKMLEIELVQNEDS